MEKGRIVKIDNALSKAAIAVALSTLAVQPAARAATDLGPTLSQPRGDAMQRAFGAQAKLALKFGSSRAVRSSERLKLGVQAGAMMASARSPATRAMAPLAAFSLSPGYGWRADVAGSQLTTHYTLVGKAEQRRPGAERLGVSTLGWVGIGVGAALIVGVLVVADAARDASY